MTKKDTKAENAKPYHTPKLEVHGELSTITQQAGSGTPLSVLPLSGF